MTGSARPDHQRVVVTGVGAVSAFGWGRELLWRGLVSGLTTVGRPQRFDVGGQRTDLASEVPEAPSSVSSRVAGWHRLSQADRFAVVSAGEAVAQAGIASLLPSAGLYFGGSTAGMAEGERFVRALLENAPRPPLQWTASQTLNNPGDAVARSLGIGGPVLSLSSACASGALAIGAAVAALRSGEVEVAVAGGSDSLCQLTYSGFNALRAVDSEPCRPFRRDRAGLSLGEGAAVLVLETREHASRRGARPLAELLGAGASCDAFHMTAPDPDGRGAAAAIVAALADAGLEPNAIDFVNAHGTGTPHNDAAEWQAMLTVFGARAGTVPVTSTKGAIGHLLGSAGAIEAVATVLCLSARTIHPTPGEGEVDPIAPVELVRRPRPIAAAARALSTNLAFGGANAALVLAGLPEALS